MTVSLIIPTYNRAHLIALAIESALAQTRVPDEILIIDDGSTDNTAEVLSRFAAPVRLLRQPNRGRSVARNLGLRAATGDAVLFLDSDDLLLPRTVETFTAVLERQPDVDVVYGDAELIDIKGRRIGLNSERTLGRRPSGNILGELGRRCCLTMASMVRRSALAGIAFEEGMECGEDYDFWRRLAARSQFAYVDVPVMCYRMHEGMTVTADPTNTLDMELEVQRRIQAMPEFAALPRRERAGAYAAHGAKQAMRNRGRVARSMFWRAIRTDPSYLTAYALLGLSLFSLRPLQYAVLKRRRMIGNEVAAETGDAVLERLRTTKCAELPTPNDAERELVGAVEESVYG